MGLDKTTNTNVDYCGTRSRRPLASVGVEGWVMIRPVLRAGKELVTSVEDVASTPPTSGPAVFPNLGRRRAIGHWNVTSVRIRT